MSLRLRPPSPDLLDRGTPLMGLLVEAAARLGGRIELEETFGYLGRYTAPDGSRRPIFGKSLGLNRDSAAAIAADKDYTARLLAADGLPAVSGKLVFSPAYRERMTLKNADVASCLPGRAAALEFAQNVGFPVVAKPNSGSEGHGVTLARDTAALERALETLFRTEDRVRVEAHVPGRDYRLLVFDGRVRLAYERRPLALTGDGRQTIADLLDAALSDLATRHRGAKIARDDARIADNLRRAGFNLRAVPEAGQVIPVLDNANLSTGGTLHDVTGTLPPEAETLACRAAGTLGLRVAGVDILAPNLETGIENATILEVNSAPGLDYYAGEGPAQRSRAFDLITDMLAAT